METNALRIEQIISAVRAAAATGGAIHIPEQGNDELSELVHGLNELFFNVRSRDGVSRRFQCLIDNTSSIIYSSVPACDFKITYVSENVTRILGYKSHEILSESNFWFNHIHEDDAEKIFSALPHLLVNTQYSCQQQIYEYRFRHKDGSYIWMNNTLCLVRDSEGTVCEIIGSMTDITQRRKVEQELQNEKEHQKSLVKQLQEAHDQLLQFEKMASIGQLAAGVAHEINNPVGYVSSNLGSLKKYITDLFRVLNAYEAAEKNPGAYNENVNNIQSIKMQIDVEFLKVDIDELINESLMGVRRVREIVQDLKSFSHVNEVEWQISDIHKGLDSTLNIVHSEIKYKAVVIKEYGDIPPVECLASQLNQVFMNLLVNAAHAIEDRGTIIVNTGVHDNWVWIEISDDGKGIPQENLNRIFEPFFTTKPVGEGTGLGLSLSHGIIKKHGGCFDVHSEIGKGTKFKIWLPVRHDHDHVGKIAPSF